MGRLARSRRVRRNKIGYRSQSATLFEVYSQGNEMVDVTLWHSRPLVHFAACALVVSVKLDSDYSRTGHEFLVFDSFVEDFRVLTLV